jgi:hypothetical protein
MAKFDYNALKNHQVKTKAIIIEKNKPNFDRMAAAFHKLLKQ